MVQAVNRPSYGRGNALKVGKNLRAAARILLVYILFSKESASVTSVGEQFSFAAISSIE